MNNLAKLHKLYDKCVHVPTGHTVQWHGTTEQILRCACGCSFATDNGGMGRHYRFNLATKEPFIDSVANALPIPMRKEFLAYVRSYGGRANEPQTI